MRAGDATFHQGRTAHYPSANTTDQARLYFLVTFTDADATPARYPATTRSTCNQDSPSHATDTPEHPNERHPMTPSRSTASGELR